MAPIFLRLLRFLPAAGLFALSRTAYAHVEEEVDVLQRFDETFAAWVVGPIAKVFFFDLAFWDNGQDGELQLPVIVVWLVFGAVFFTLRYNFPNLRAFGHAIQVTRGDLR